LSAIASVFDYASAFCAEAYRCFGNLIQTSAMVNVDKVDAAVGELNQHFVRAGLRFR
jgi:hypothetical protein